jgi:hypothetical protein
MSFFDESSLCLIPSGYKDQKLYAVKPLDGSGDLTFTRASSATRVASNGLIEKVRTNVILQSNTFGTTWTLDDATLTSGQSGYDGTSNAWLLAKTAAGGRVQQTLSLSSNSHTFSVYVKAGTKNWVFLRADGTSNRTSYFDLQNGVVGTASGCTASIVSAGNGWYRCSISYVDTTTSARIWVADADGDISGTSGNILIQAAQAELGDIATDYIATTTAAVSVGPVSGLPRLDYLGSTCPRLLLEPQRTSNVQFSEAFDNAWWTKTNVTLTSTLGGPIDQSKYFTITCDGTAGTFKGVGRTFINASANTYTLSVFAKAGTASSFVVSSRATLTTDDVRAIFNLSNGTITNTNGGTATIVPYGDGWYRCTFTVVNAGTFTNEASIFFGHPFGAADGATVLATGAMSEIGAYATSLIPTLSTSVTRVADAASKTGISSLIGATEGVIFLDFEIDNLSTLVAGGTVFVYLRNGSSDEAYIAIYASGRLQALMTGGGTVDIGSYVTQGGRFKIAFAYKQNDFALYMNGSLVGTDNSGTVPALSEFGLQYYDSAFTSTQKVNQALLFKTRLPNSDLATLTSL